MKSASLSQKAYSMLMFLAISVLAGLLLSGLAVPFTALVGGATKAGADSMRYLPEELETPPQSERSVVKMADGSELANFFEENRTYVTLDQIAPIMQEAQIAIEDHRFYEHGAIDPTGLLRAFFRTISGDTQGASTLTQQYVKLVQVETATINNDEEAKKEATEVSLERKIREMRYAMAVEERLSKNEILERYLNIAYYGDGAYGIESAANHYFNVKASDLTLAQSSLLAGLVQNPVQLNPVNYPERALERRDVVLNRMVETEVITQAEADEAKQETFDASKVVETPNGCVTSEFPFLCDYVERVLVSDQMPDLGDTEEERSNTLRRGGLTIQTLIDPTAQADAEKAVANKIAATDPVIAGTVLIQPKTGLITAMAQSRPDMGEDEGETYWNYNVSSEMGGAEGYQAGSTFKPFTMAAAFEAGASSSKSYNSPKSLDIQGMTFKNCSGPFVFRDDHTVNNYDSGYGVIDMKKATEASVNTYYTQLIRDIGICAAINVAKEAGVEMANGDDLDTQQNNPSFVLGTAEVTPMSMAEAYATFANRGVHCEPIILQSVVTRDGTNVPVPSADCKQVIDAEVADGVSYILQSVMSNGTGRTARMSDGRPQAGKTGTTNSNEAVWFAGYTPEMAGVAMIAVDKTSDFWEGRTKTTKNIRLPSGAWLSGSGGGDAGDIWKAAMGSALQDKPRTDFNDPARRILEGVKVKVPDVSGMSYDQAKTTLEAAGFSTTRYSVYSNYPVGTFLGISPSGTAAKFSTILLQVSAGPKPEPEPTVSEEETTEGDEGGSTDQEDTGGGEGNTGSDEEG